RRESFNARRCWRVSAANPKCSCSADALAFQTSTDTRSLCSYGFAHSVPPQPALFAGDVKQASQPALRVIPSPRAQVPQHLVLSLGPERARNVQHPSALPREPHRLDAPVGVRTTVDRPIPLKKLEAPRQRRLVDGERVLELPQIRLA